MKQKKLKWNTLGKVHQKVAHWCHDPTSLEETQSTWTTQ
jgi:hypothetical protein